MNQWLSPRLWRSPRADFHRDEPLNALAVYTDDELDALQKAGFDAIWLRGRLYDLMDSAVFPQLNQSLADIRRHNLRELVQRARRHGIGVWLYFNEPHALPVEHSFWNEHEELQGTLHLEYETHQEVRALCTSQPQVQEFFRDALTGLFRELHGLAGVVLITASEYHTHCWSRHAIIPIADDPHMRQAAHELSCPRCRRRGPAAVVLELLQEWINAARPAGVRVIAWNWSWSMWYGDPQAEIVAHLPDGVELLVDWERGGTRPWRDRLIPIDEYSIGFVGPSARFTGARAIVPPQDRPLHARFQLDTTHELATVPNLPLIPNLHAKLVGFYRQGVAGMMGCWSFGSERTLNTHAFAIFAADPARWLDANEFLPHVAHSYFGEVNTAQVIAGWQLFGEAFLHYPFCFGMLYHSPFNYAPAYPFGQRYEAKTLGPSWLFHDWGDRIDDCLGGWPLEEVADSFAQLRDTWARGLALYRQALENRMDDHCREELHCAEMIGCHAVSFENILRFHRWRQRTMAQRGLTPPCTLEFDDGIQAILRAELTNVRAALELVRKDPRLGFHQECQTQFVSVTALEQKIESLVAATNQLRRENLPGETPCIQPIV